MNQTNATIYVLRPLQKVDKVNFMVPWADVQWQIIPDYKELLREVVWQMNWFVYIVIYTEKLNRLSLTELDFP